MSKSKHNIFFYSKIIMVIKLRLDYFINLMMEKIDFAKLDIYLIEENTD